MTGPLTFSAIRLGHSLNCLSFKRNFKKIKNGDNLSSYYLFICEIKMLNVRRRQISKKNKSSCWNIFKPQGPPSIFSKQSAICYHLLPFIKSRKKGKRTPLDFQQTLKNCDWDEIKKRPNTGPIFCDNYISEEQHFCLFCLSIFICEQNLKIQRSL